MKPELKEVLEMIDRLNPDDLAIVQEKIAPSQKRRSIPIDEKMALSKNDVFSLSFEEYLALPDDEREDVQWRAYQLHQTWADAELNRHGAHWLLVCHGEIIEASSNWGDYPSREKLMTLGKQSGYVPFLFVREPLIEESVWSSLPGSDFYPTLQITVGSQDCHAEELSLSGLALMADFDSGSPNLFLDYELMFSYNIIDRQLIDQAHFRSHLGQVYSFHVLPVVVAVTDEQGIIKMKDFQAFCVHDWHLSPLCQVNPNRQALAGRNLLLEFPLRVELDGRLRVTTIHSNNV